MQLHSFLPALVVLLPQVAFAATGAMNMLGVSIPNSFAAEQCGGIPGYSPCKNIPNGCCPTGVDCIPPNKCDIKCRPDDPPCGANSCCPKGQRCTSELTCELDTVLTSVTLRGTTTKHVDESSTIELAPDSTTEEIVPESSTEEPSPKSTTDEIVPTLLSSSTASTTTTPNVNVTVTGTPTRSTYSAETNTRGAGATATAQAGMMGLALGVAGALMML